MTSQRRRPLALSAFPGFPRGHWAGRTSRCLAHTAPGPASGPAHCRGANQTRAMPRREMRVAGNQGQGPGHNGAIVGLQSVDFQAAVPHPPSLLLHIPAPLPGSYPNLLPPFLPPPEGNRIPDPTPNGGGRAAPCMAYYAHQVATEHYTSEGEGSNGRPGDRSITDQGVGLPCPSCFIQKTKLDYIFLHPLL